jgi:hypothetical protein
MELLLQRGFEAWFSWKIKQKQLIISERNIEI